jgi:hypothetical protein
MALATHAIASVEGLTSDCHCGQRQPTILMLACPSYTSSLNLVGDWMVLR